MLPTHQCLHADDLPGAHVDARLDVQPQLVAFDRLSDPHQLELVGLIGLILHRLEELVAIAPLLLGLIHRVIGVTQEGVRIACVLREERDAGASGDGERMAVDQDGLSERGEHAFQKRGTVRQ
jgi:hypothetical protein